MSPRRTAAWLAAGALLSLVAVLAAVILERPAGSAALGFARARATAGREGAALSGSASCRRCHAAFFEKWATSFHGLALRPYTPALARELLSPQTTAIEVQGRRYRAVVGTAADHVEEEGPEGRKSYALVAALGGKDVFYFLTPRERGFLQTLPVAYDVRRREWFSTTASAVRHLEGVTDEELPWTDRAYTFNTSCFACHVSQLRTNYDPASDSYHTEWAEPGINCETCHGPGAEHVRQFEARAGAAGEPGAAAELRLVSFRRLGREQRNDLCASCHAKAAPLSAGFRPGERFFDHFDLVTLESADYYADGRDRGENYTYGSWRMSPCVRSGRLDCMQCHTSSGRYKWQGDPNGACRSCHAERVANVAAHSHHRADGPGSVCTACHMPTTEFARMRRSDHSMRPPSPAATLAFGSPNACTGCHADKDARWAERALSEWRHGMPSVREGRLLREGRLVTAARRGEWSQLPAILAYLALPGRDEIVTASLLRLLRPCSDPRRFAAARSLCGDASPLVRAAAVALLSDDPAGQGRLLAATHDESRLVRLRAADALASRDPATLPAAERPLVIAAQEDLVRSLETRQDQFAAHAALGDLALARGALDEAVTRYRRALALRPDHAGSLVNLAMAHARLGQLPQAEQALRRAVGLEPRNAAARYDLGLLLAERGDPAAARSELEQALGLDPRLAGAAYNLALLVEKEDPRSAAKLAHRAAALDPEETRYAWTEASLAATAGDLAGAERLLRAFVKRHPSEAAGWDLLGSVLARRGASEDARQIFARAAASADLTPDERAAFRARAARGTPGSRVAGGERAPADRMPKPVRP